MATRKKYFMNLKFETREDYEKHFHEIYYSGREDGIQKGIEIALSYFLELLDKDIFSNNDRRGNAEYILRNRNLKTWKNKQKMYDAIGKKAVEDYKKSLEES